MDSCYKLDPPSRPDPTLVSRRLAPLDSPPLQSSNKGRSVLTEGWPERAHSIAARRDREIKEGALACCAGRGPPPGVVYADSQKCVLGCVADVLHARAAAVRRGDALSLARFP